ncbi:MAG: hypothetical protein LBN10_06365 [Propionibacteriaceae bacterium]|nr:hypothetical protein [Propionibacteriaceae bacterium]
MSDTDRPLLQQAPVAPLDASGFTASVVGTVMFGLLLVASLMWSFPPPWPSILFVGTALGGALICYTAWHRNRAVKREQAARDNKE